MKFFLPALLLAAPAMFGAETLLFRLPANGGEPIPAHGEIVLKAGDALRIVPPVPSGDAPQVLAFDTFTDTPPASLNLRPLRSVGVRFRAVNLDPPGPSQGWAAHRRKVAGLPVNWEALQLDFGLPAGGELRLRAIEWRAERPGEFDPPRPRPLSADAALLDAELARKYPAKIGAVEVGAEEIRIRGSAAGAGAPLFLAEIPMDCLLGEEGVSAETVAITPGADGTFVAVVPRMRQRSGLPHDRLVSRWRLLRGEGENRIPVSHAHYASEIACRSPDLRPPVIPGKKGLGGWTNARLPDEIGELGIHAITVNMVVDLLLAPASSQDSIPFTWQGRTYHANRRTLGRFDAMFRKATEQDVVVSVILLVRNPARGGAASQIAHPGATTEGTFAMPDTVSENGIAAYGAILNLIAERWTRPGFPNGRVHHWIVHNEVDAGWTWTNAGKLPALPYMDLYQRSLRLTDLIVRQYDPHARPFISLTHHWAKPGPPVFHGSRRLLELLARFTAAEGDFPWALAYHPYPSSLRNPRTWEDKDANFTFDTPKITPRNIEVLDAWMKRPQMLYRGTVRPVHLSENGFNSPDYSQQNLADQAAGMAYAWKKIAPLDSIKVWHYHNWIDNRAEGGLRIGLRRFPDDEGEPLGKKPIWHLYRDLGTLREDSACAPYLDVVGIGGWEKIRYADPIQ